MKRVYACNNLLDLNAIKFALNAKDIKFLVKNEHGQSITGEVPFTENWPEIWVLKDNDYAKAKDICLATESGINSIEQDWICSHCNESNAASFEICWQCHAIKS